MIRQSHCNITCLLLATVVCIAGCTSPQPAVVHYSVTTQSSLKCCRNLKYTVESFKAITKVPNLGDSTVLVRFHQENVAGACDTSVVIPLTISNGTPHDIYIPFSNELSGDTVKLYPWRLLTIEWKPLRVARQLQYGDLLERTDARLRFFRLPAGMQTRLTGMIPTEWVCAEPREPHIGYLEAELNPVYYANYSRWLRAHGTRKPDTLISPVGLRYDVVYTTLDYVETLPVLEQTSSSGNDSIAITLGVREKPEEFIINAQELAESNVISLKINQ